MPDKNAAAHRVLSNAKILKEMGHKVIFMGVDKTIPWGNDVLNTYNEVQGFGTYSVPYPNDNKSWIEYLTNISDYKKIMRENNVGMVIFYNFQAIAMKRLMDYCRKQQIKCCADVTEWRSAKGENIIYRILKDSDTWYRMRVLHKRLDGLIVISKYLQNYYRKCKNVVYIPALTDSSEKKWQGVHEKSNDILKLVYAGSPARKDRLDKLLEALDQVERKFILDVIGITAEQYTCYYPHLSEILKKHNEIVFHGRMSHLETLEYVKNANYSCFLRENNRVSSAGFPTKFAEAITCGTPVLTNKTSNLVDFASEGKNCILIDRLDLNECARVIENLPLRVDVDKNLFDYRNYVHQMEGLF